MKSMQADANDYERWLREHCDVVEKDLAAKHKKMRRSAFDFFRASYFRWCRCVDDMFPGLDAPRVLCVGDIHVENYGTWRDADSRLVWGINDFDEASPMPYVLDLVRLATSACLMSGMPLGPGLVCRSIHEGYVRGLEDPRPVLLDEHDPWLHDLVSRSVDSPVEFWRDIDACPEARPPKTVRQALVRSLPEASRLERFASRTKGGGSLGRPRYLAIASWQGGRVVREAKATVPSAWYWAHEALKVRRDGMTIAQGRFRSVDPSLILKARFGYRRVAPDAVKIDLGDIDSRAVGQQLLAAMAAELAAVHASHRNRAKVLRDVKARRADWLEEHVASALKQVNADYEAYAGDKPEP